MLKGPTGCGKTRFIEHMAWRLKRPLVTVSCHDDLSAADLVGRFLIRDNGTVWQDGPLTRAVRLGAICYLDEVRSRQELVYLLNDYRRVLPTIKPATVQAEPGLDVIFTIPLSHVPDLKPRTATICCVGFRFLSRTGEAHHHARSGRNEGRCMI